jgi:hypothetical protein
MRKSVFLFSLCLLGVTAGANAATRARIVAPAAPNQAVTSANDDANWPHASKLQLRRVKTLDDCEVDPSSCIYDLDPSIGTGSGGAGCTWSGCKANYSCSLIAGMCQSRTYGHCKDDASQGSCSQACIAC